MYLGAAPESWVDPELPFPAQMAQVVDADHQTTHSIKTVIEHASGDRPTLAKKKATPMTTSPTAG
jgi:hypothetical protein